MRKYLKNIKYNPVGNEVVASMLTVCESACVASSTIWQLFEYGGYPCSKPNLQFRSDSEHFL